MGCGHAVRVMMNVSFMIGGKEVPVAVSVVAAAVALALGVWLLKIAFGCCCQK